MCGIPKLREDTDGCAKQHRHDLVIYLTTVLSSSYDIIMYRAMNEPGHGNNVVDGLNKMEMSYVKEKMELFSNLSSNNTSKIRMLPSASKDVSLKFSGQCLYILNNKEKLNGIKGIKKIAA